MSVSDELSFDKILQFMLENGGRVTNHELVKHFKVYLTDPANRAEARETFKKHVNTLASIKNQNNEKWLILKRKYMATNKELPEPPTEVSSCDVDNEDLDKTPTPLSPQCEPFNDSFRSPPPYIPPPEFSPRSKPSTPTDITSAPIFPQLNIINSTTENNCEAPSLEVSEIKDGPSKQENEETEIIPQALSSPIEMDMRSASPDELQHSVSSQENLQSEDIPLHLRRDSNSTIEDKEQVIVKERKKVFSRNNGEGDVKPRPMSTRKSSHRIDVQKRSSGMPQLDQKAHEWIIRSSSADYDTLAKMCENNPQLVKIKDPVTGYTALHWAAKKGEDRLVKLLATLAPSIVNEKTSGGYTPLHIAMQFRHETVYKMLIDVFDADPNVTDYSGRKPRQYPVSLESWSPIKKATKKQSEMGFLRIGSLNIRVKKTTSAVSNFLGVGASRIPGSYRTASPKHRSNTGFGETTSEIDHLKSWGSADNIPDTAMPPPSTNRVKRRSSRSGHTSNTARGEVQSRSTPSTPNQPRALLSHDENSHDSDSDSAAGFHAEWRAKRNSHI